MERLSEQLANCDRESFRRIAHNMPEAPAERPQVEQTAEIFNSLFSALRAAFPAAMAAFREQSEFNELRRQWVMAFQENGITTMAQVAAGMRIARRQEKPFLPSPGQFVAWCKEGRCLLGFSVDDVMTEYWKWRRLVFRFPTSEQYPWPAPVLYHICIELRRQSTDRQMTESEMRQAAGKVLAGWEERVAAGKPVPPIRRAIAAPAKASGPTPAEMLKAQYAQRKAAGLI
ncbi:MULTISPECIES: replication protein P [unclassified Leclercia]|uniref:replication protein P n=1 Tax=unclassified Leclercia TaxID=2627398 RepID=UPI000CD1270B|nr:MULTISPECIES: replication protein P [unclassified Leclercia]AUU85385.1 phage replication protein [Leclercia sp. LSNIH1]POV33994.1 phage replication protein [Leclercia sp. LSNIH5]POW66420.1 phage replication protein [Leclercia sp. LSNIH2]UGB01840.1 phage replication protein [Leclercia sp. G3L]